MLKKGYHASMNDIVEANYIYCSNVVFSFLKKFLSKEHFKLSILSEYTRRVFSVKISTSIHNVETGLTPG